MGAALCGLFLATGTGWAQKAGSRPGEINTPPARSERYPEQLRTGAAAPDFTLPAATGTRTITLSSFQGKKPVVLIFGSHT
jgi:hypothetical protein